MTAYLVGRIEINDMAQYQEYTRLTPAIIEKFGGRFIARGGATMTLEGPEETRRIVLVEFPSMAQARAFYESPEYQQAINVRAGAATAHFIVVEGL